MRKLLTLFIILGILLPIVSGITFINTNSPLLNAVNTWIENNIFNKAVTILGDLNVLKQANVVDLNVDSGIIRDGTTEYPFSDLNLHVTNVCSGDANSVENSQGVCLDVTNWSVDNVGAGIDFNGADINAHLVYDVNLTNENCDVKGLLATGELVCGTDEVGAGSSPNYYTAGANLILQADDQNRFRVNDDNLLLGYIQGDALAAYLAGANLVLRDGNYFDIADGNLFDQNRFITGDYNITHVGATEFFGNIEYSYIQNPPWLTSVITYPIPMPIADGNVADDITASNYRRKNEDINSGAISDWNGVASVDANSIEPCAQGQIWKYDNGGWSCAADATGAGGDGIASYKAGANIFITDENAIGVVDNNLLNGYIKGNSLVSYKEGANINISPTDGNAVIVDDDNLFSVGRRVGQDWNFSRVNTIDLNVDSGNISDGATSYSLADLNRNSQTVCDGSDANQVVTYAGVCQVVPTLTASGSADVNGTDVTVGYAIVSNDLNVDGNTYLASNINIKKHMYLGYEQPEQDSCIYFREDASNTGEALCWDDFFDNFQFTDELSVTGLLYSSANIQANTSVTAGTTISAGSDIWTTGAGDDLWLGTTTQGPSNFQAYATGALDSNSYGCFIAGGCSHKNVGDFEALNFFSRGWLNAKDLNVTGTSNLKDVNISGDVNLTGGDLNINQGNLMLIDSNICGYFPIADGTLRMGAHFTESEDGLFGEDGKLGTSNLKGIWHFEEGTGTTYADDSGSANNLALGTAPDWTASGKYGSALDFEATNLDYLTAGDDTDFEIGNNSFSMGLWFKAETPAGNNWFHSKWATGQREYRLAWNANALDFTISRDGTVNAGAFTSLNTGATYTDTTAFHFIVATYNYNATADTSVMKIYYDGAEVATTSTAESGVFAGTAVFNLGKQADGTNYPDGIIDEPFFVKGMALSTNEVLMLYNNRWYGRTYFDGKFGTGYYAFDGSDLNFATANNIRKDQGTIEMWVKPSWDGNDGVGHAFFSTSDGVSRLSFYKGSGNSFTFLISNASGSRYILTAATAANFAKNVWHHLAGTWNNASFEVYLDGVLLSNTEEGAGDGLMFAVVSPFYVGSYYDLTLPAQAIIDEFRIYGRALSAQEIYCNYKSSQQYPAGE